MMGVYDMALIILPLHVYCQFYLYDRVYFNVKVCFYLSNKKIDSILVVLI